MTPGSLSAFSTLGYCNLSRVHHDIGPFVWPAPGMAPPSDISLCILIEEVIDPLGLPFGVKDKLVLRSHGRNEAIYAQHL